MRRTAVVIAPRTLVLLFLFLQNGQLHAEVTILCQPLKMIDQKSVEFGLVAITIVDCRGFHSQVPIEFRTYGNWGRLQGTRIMVYWVISQSALVTWMGTVTWKWRIFVLHGHIWVIVALRNALLGRLRPM